MSKDVNFIHFVDIHKSVTTRFSDRMEALNESEKETILNQLNYLGNIEGLNENQLNEVAELLGFTTLEEYKAWKNDAINTASKLRTSYPQFSSSNIETSSIIEKSTLIVFNRNIGLHKTQASCYEIYRNCEASATSVLMGVSVGCVVMLSVPVVGAAAAVSCEIAAIATHYHTVTGCGYTYDNCVNK